MTLRLGFKRDPCGQVYEPWWISIHSRKYRRSHWNLSRWYPASFPFHAIRPEMVFNFRSEYASFLGSGPSSHKQDSFNTKAASAFFALEVKSYYILSVGKDQQHLPARSFQEGKSSMLTVGSCLLRSLCVFPHCCICSNQFLQVVDPNDIAQGCPIQAEGLSIRTWTGSIDSSIYLLPYLSTYLPHLYQIRGYVGTFVQVRKHTNTYIRT